VHHQRSVIDSNVVSFVTRSKTLRRVYEWANMQDALDMVSVSAYYVIAARCTLVHSAVSRSHVVCLSVRPSVTLVDCDHMGWNSSKLILPLVSLVCSLFATPT